MKNFSWKKLLVKSTKRAVIAAAGVGGAAGVSVPADQAALVTIVSTILTFVFNAIGNWAKNHKN